MMAKLEQVKIPDVQVVKLSKLRRERLDAQVLLEKEHHAEVEEYIIHDLKPSHEPKPFYSLMDTKQAVMLFDKRTNCLRKSIFNSPKEAKDMCSLLRHYPENFVLVPVEVHVKGAK
jgi:hypothetical protein